MREIVFKAKTKMIVGTYNCGKDDGEWVIGHLYHDTGKYVICQFEFDRADYIGYEVDPETICQFIGIADKRGINIFESSIVKTKYFGKDAKNGINFSDYDIFKVVYHHCGFCLENENRRFSIPDSKELEVVGNAIDNPELLESCGGGTE